MRGGYRDRVAVVTGGTRGLGYSIACELARRGAKVAAIDNVPGEDSSQISCYTADVAVEPQLEAAARDIVHRYGRIDLLVNNAAVSASAPFACIPAEMFQRILQVGFFEE